MTPPKLLYRFDSRESEGIVAWARYVYWAEVECQQYEAHVPVENESSVGPTTILMAQFYAALWVAIEGWQHCSLSDPLIDELLTHPAFERNIHLLRRFRNGVYHYQRDLINERLLGFMREGEHAVHWAFLVHAEFQRVIWEMTHPAGLTLSLQTELAGSLRELIGWLPDGIAEAAPHDADIRYSEVMAMIPIENRSSPEAEKLIDAVETYRSTARKADQDWRAYKRSLLEALKTSRLQSLESP